MKHLKLAALEAAIYAATDVLVITFEDLTETAAETPQTLSVAVEKGDVIGGMKYWLKKPFRNTADAAHNTTTLKVGETGDDDRFLASKELNLNGTEILGFAGGGSGNHEYVFPAAGNILLVFGSMAAKALASINEGEIWILYNRYNIEKVTRTVI